jgi:glycosyltransferase involved in cell wall biosynthesis
MLNKLLSVIIPTGGKRVPFLAHTIETVLSQWDADVELIVSDNDQTCTTSDFIVKLNDKRIQYIRTPHRLNMTDHWNFAIDSALGEYIMILGDDDGLLPGALARVRRVIREERPDIVFAELDFYQWPVKGLGGRITRVARSQSEGFVDLQKVMASILYRGGSRWERLPSFYRAFVCRKIFEHLKSMTSKYADTMNPDVYSGFSIACLPGLRAFKLSYPIAICGVSYDPADKLITLFQKSGSGIGHELVNEYRNAPKVDLPKTFSVAFNSFAESIVLAVRRFGNGEKRYKLNYSAHLAWMASWSKSLGPASIWKNRSALRPFGVSISSFLIWWIMYRLWHSFTKWRSVRLSILSEKQGLNDVTEAAAYLAKLRTSA